MTYEHQERYRRRTTLKARYFDLTNDHRVEKLLSETQHLPNVPEMQMYVPFFLSHPRANYIPEPGIGKGVKMFEGWFISLSKPEDPDAWFHATLAYIALESATSLPVTAYVDSGSSVGFVGEHADLTVRVRKEIEELRACGMWVIE